jgi:hypothetical protein
VVKCDYAHAANCIVCRCHKPGDDCPHCVAGIWATWAESGENIPCESCRATGRVQVVTEFAALASAVVTNTGEIDVTAAFALADYLEERGDERGVRLWRRAKMHESSIREAAYWRGLAVYELYPDLRTYWQKRLAYMNDVFASYLYRLLSVPSGEPTPRETAGGGYVLREPGTVSEVPK